MPDCKILYAEASRKLIVNDSVKDRGPQSEKYDGYSLQVMGFFSEHCGSPTAAESEVERRK